MTRSVFDELVGQSRVAGFLRSASAGDAVSHAYLFVGPPGAGKATAARALACAVLCNDGGCGGCAICHRVKRGGHPDVHVIRPQGAAGYLAEQIREIIHDIYLAPIEGRYKVYVVHDADLFNDSSANAFLKTLEEPPHDVVVILMAHTYDAVLPTIASRCQVVRFRRIPNSEAVSLLVSETGAESGEAAAALAAAGGVVPRARDFLASPPRREARALILHVLGNLASADGSEVLNSAKELLTAVKAPLEDVKAAQAAESADSADLLGRGAMKSLDERHKRELTAREREGVGEVLNVAESWLRDCLVVSQGVGDLAVNADSADSVAAMGAIITPAAAVTALEAVNTARKRITYNVSPQLAIEAMLFDIREVLRCPR